jgi:hypothetical protein
MGVNVNILCLVSVPSVVFFSNRVQTFTSQFFKSN